jgi:hypothetical protein
MAVNSSAPTPYDGHGVSALIQMIQRLPVFTTEHQSQRSYHVWRERVVPDNSVLTNRHECSTYMNRKHNGCS